MHGKKPTLKQKKLIAKWKLNPLNWLVLKNESDKLTISHRHTGRKRTIPEGVK
ncbi:DUF6906 family protein [Anaerovorax sp. IOR16]|uniref:DUF6906 family protein n=1 Tax=Anaerovorax sp. IOR16 TaxID=2773458 RepID=UPI0019CF93A1|nr:hypothetical protein [Anaerovorax sp. IOR16]